MIAAVPGHSGAAWTVLQYLLGLRRLGHDVHFVEDVRAVDIDHDVPMPETRMAAWCASVMVDFGLSDCWTLIGHEGRFAGASRERLGAFCRDADLLIDLSGRAAKLGEAMAVPVRLYVDLDPGFTQGWHADGIDVGVDGH